MLSKFVFLKYYFSKIFLKKDKNFFLKIPAEKLFFTSKIKVSEIKFFLKKKDIKNKKFFFWDGNWDKKKLKIEDYNKANINYNSVFQIFKRKKKYYQSDEYKHKSKIILSGKKTDRGQKSISDLKKYFKLLNNLKLSLKRNGYLNQSQLKDGNINDEIGVVVGRNGEIIKLEDKFGGTHRFALCKILKINKVYINIKAIHLNYLKKNISQFAKQYDDKKLIELIKNKIKKQYLISKN